jgi:hypothetical protein
MGLMIYLDHNGTTPILPEVLEAMMPCSTSQRGNRSKPSPSAQTCFSGLRHSRVAHLRRGGPFMYAPQSPINCAE